MQLVIPQNRELSDLLSNASSAELNVLADIITDRGKGRVALDATVKARIVDRKERGLLQAIPHVLESEIRKFGGNTILNLARSQPVTYFDVAKDVAKKLGGKPGKGDDICTIEDIAIKQALLKSGIRNTAYKANSSASLAQLSLAIDSLMTTNPVTVARVAAMGGAAGIITNAGGRLTALALPPVSLAATVGTVLQAAAPAFRVTIPAVLQIAKIRRTRFDEDFRAYSDNLKACI